MELILLDTSPVIHLAMLDCLGLLESWERVIIPDMVMWEVLRYQDRHVERFETWLKQSISRGITTIPETDIGRMYQLAIQADSSYRARNAGEYAILEWIIEHLEHSDDQAVLLYENGKIPRLISEWSSDFNMDVMTTRYFLRACERRGMAVNAEWLWTNLLQQKPTINPRIEITQIRRSGL